MSQATLENAARLRAEWQEGRRAGEPAHALGIRLVSDLGARFIAAVPAEDLLSTVEDHDRTSAAEVEQARFLRALLLNLSAESERYRERLFSEFFAGSGTLYQRCVDAFFIPMLQAHFKTTIEIRKQQLSRDSGKEIDLDRAITEFVDDAYFSAVLDSFCLKWRLERVDLDLAAKVFCRSFKEHFDSRPGSGVSEMVAVGRDHPDVLQRMSNMQEYDDIRATLLRLQLTGKINSKNYR